MTCKSQVDCQKRAQCNPFILLKLKQMKINGVKPVIEKFLLKWFKEMVPNAGKNKKKEGFLVKKRARKHEIYLGFHRREGERIP